MSQSIRNTDTGNPSTTRAHRPRRRRHRLARFLWTLVVLLLILVVVAVWGLHRIGVTNSALSGTLSQLHHQSSKLTTINGRLHALLISVQNGLQKIGQELTTLIRIARQHL